MNIIVNLKIIDVMFEMFWDNKFEIFDDSDLLLMEISGFYFGKDNDYKE